MRRTRLFIKNTESEINMFVVWKFQKCNLFISEKTTDLTVSLILCFLMLRVYYAEVNFPVLEELWMVDRWCQYDWCSLAGGKHPAAN